MMTKEQIIKSLGVMLTVSTECKPGSHERLRQLAAMEGMLIVLGELDLHKKLDYLEKEEYEGCILRHVRNVLVNS